VARRPSSARSSTASAPRVAADGKVEIFCPNCAQRYRIAEDALDNKVQCSVCSNVFLPRNTVGKLARGKDHTTVYASLGFFAVVVIAGLVLIMNRGSETPVAPPEPANAAAKANAVEAERVRQRDQLIKWAQKVAAGELFMIREYSDTDALCAALGVDKRLPKDQFDAQLLRALKSNMVTSKLYEFDCNSADLGLDAAKSDFGTATLFLAPKPTDDKYDRGSSGTMAVDFKMDAGTVKVTAFRMTAMPQPRKPH
jgi:predicted Zn finger-like uncharacterized protein